MVEGWSAVPCFESTWAPRRLEFVWIKDYGLCSRWCEGVGIPVIGFSMELVVGQDVGLYA